MRTAGLAKGLVSSSKIVDEGRECAADGGCCSALSEDDEAEGGGSESVSVCSMVVRCNE